MLTIPIERGLVRTLRGRIAHDDELGIRYGADAAGSTRLELPFTPSLAAPGTDRISSGALVTALDSACGIGAMQALRFGESTATVDLRIDFLRHPASHASCIVTAAPVDIGGRPGAGMIMMSAEAREVESGILIAHAIGQFIRRPLPQGSVPDAEDLPPSPRRDAPDYRALMGFRSEPDGLRMPFRPGLIGNGALPSLHGGAIAAHMQEAASEALATASATPARLTSAHFTFLRFGKDADTVATAVIEHMGTSVASVRVTSRQAPDRVIARAVITCFRG